MTDRLASLTVVLTGDIREDDAQPIIDAIQMIKGVVAVEKQATTPNDFIARMQVRSELAHKLHETIQEVLNPKRNS